MKERVQGCVTVGVAMVGAGALALAPLGPQPAQQVRADAFRTVNTSDVKLMAAPSFAEALQILATGIGGSGQRLATDTLKGLLGTIALAQAFGDDVATKAILAEYVDAPLEIADPTIFALNEVLPAPYGGGAVGQDPRYSDDSEVLAFRAHVLYVLREQLKQALGLPSALDTTPAASTFAVTATNPVGDPTFTATRLGEGLAGSAQNFATDTALGALIPLAVAQALASPDPEAALKAIVRNVVDAPLHIVDPTLFALNDVLPAPYGQDPDDLGGASEVNAFRVQVLYALRQLTRQALGVNDASGLPDQTVVPHDPSDDPVGDPVWSAVRLGEGLGESGVRAAISTAKGLAAPITAAQAIAGGAPANLVFKQAIDDAIDAPAYIADPTVFAIDDVLPKALGGGDPSTNPKNMYGSAVSKFRADVILKTRDAIKAPIDAALTPAASGVAAGNAKTAKSTTGGSKVTTTTTSTGPKHRAPSTNPIGSAIKKLRDDVKKAVTPKKDDKPAT